jgi:hypothetical protein
MRTLAGFAAVAMMVVTVTACDSNSSPTAPTGGVVDAPLAATLARAIQDEYLAEAIYQGVLNDFGQLQPFVNVLGAEVRHSTAIGRLYVARGLAVPVSTSNVATVPHFTTVAAACAAGTVAERKNIAMYDDLLRADLPADVRQVFSNNRSASALNHLPAFERCS